MKDVQGLLEKLNDVGAKVRRYLPLLFGCLLLIIYGFVFYRINSLNNAAPSPGSTASQTAQVPRIDPALITQLQSLQDNSTSVQTLFDQARDNPFQE